MSTQSPHSHFDTSKEAQSQRGKRRRGNRAKLAQRFFEDLYVAWEEQGEAILARAAFHDPVAFAGMVARLMPQKIEIATPTDGMTDERLADLLELADRMASLKAATVIEGHAVGGVAALPGPDVALSPHATNHEKTDLHGASKEGGGGPLREVGGGGVKTPHTIAAAESFSADKPEAQYNKLGEERASMETIKSRVAELTRPREDQVAVLPPHPVGRPQPYSDVEAERLNKSKLVERRDDPVDPSSLF